MVSRLSRRTDMRTLEGSRNDPGSCSWSGKSKPREYEGTKDYGLRTKYNTRSTSFTLGISSRSKDSSDIVFESIKEEKRV